MKKIISIFLLVTMFELFTPLMPPTAAATPPVATPASELAELRPCPAGTYRVRRKSRRGRRIVNSLIAGGIGAAIGGGIGGGRGALLGLGAGTGGYLVYRYVKTRKGTCVRRAVRG